MHLRLGTYQTIENKIEVSLPYETAGDLELLSLHRIKHRICSLPMHQQVKEYLVGELAKANANYKKESGKDWNCITPNSLDNTVESVKKYFEKQVELGLSKVENQKLRTALKEKLTKQISIQIKTIKQWIYDNYDNLTYNTDGKIPYLVVKKMREQLGKWVLENVNPFKQPIYELLEETIKSLGKNPDSYKSYEDMWEDLKRN